MGGGGRVSEGGIPLNDVDMQAVADLFVLLLIFIERPEEVLSKQW